MSRPRRREQKFAQELKEHRKAEIFEGVYRQRETQTAIAKRLGVSQPYVAQLLRELRAESAAAYKVAIEETVYDELEFLQHHEQRLLEIFEASREPRVREREYALRSKNADGTSTTKVTKVVRTRTTPVLSVRAVDSLVRISEQRIRMILPLDKAQRETADAKRIAQQRQEPQLTKEQIAINFVNALKSMADRADAEEAARQAAAHDGRE